MRGVRDNQNVDNARPLGPNVFVGPVETTLSQTALVGSYIVYLSSTYSIRATDRVSIMLDNGVPFLVYVAAVLNGFIVIGNPLPYQASSGNVFYDYGYGFPGPTGLANDGGVVQLLHASGYPSSFSGLPAGALWNNGGVIGIVSGSTPNPLAAEVFFGLITADQLLQLGGGNLPTSPPPISGSNQLWNNGGEVAVAFFATSGLTNNGGWVQVVSYAGYPISPSGLPVGSFWDNGGIVSIVGPTTPNPAASPVYFSAVTSFSLLALGGANLPLTSPPTGSGQLYNNGGILCVA